MKGSVAGLSGPLALVLLLPMEAGVPIPVPADLVMFTVGERVAAGKFPLWLAVVAFEVIAVLGTTALFLACRVRPSGSSRGSGRASGSPGRGSAARRPSPRPGAGPGWRWDAGRRACGH
jgi:hypothetical protein